MNRSQDPLDRAIDAIRGDAAPAPVVEAAARRVHAELARASATAGSAGADDACAGFRTLIPAYRARTLAPGQKVLLEDHAASCLACRRALRGAPLTAASISAAVERRSSRRFLLAAAALLAAVGLGAVLVTSRVLAPDPGGRLVVVESIDGALLSVPATGHPAPVTAGDRLDGSVPLRTTRGSRALVRLADGSRVELRERSEITVSADQRGKTIELARGGVLVHAAKQRDGHLYLSTGDCLVSVTGTVFTVDRGTKGSRVSVLEGEVRVDDGRQARDLHPGDQVTTAPGVELVPLLEDFSWSRDRERYAELFRELAAVGVEVEAATHELPLPAASHLLDVAPSDTVIYAALPNVTDSLSEGYRILRQRIAESATLRPYWTEHVASREAAIDEVVGEIRALGGLLGEEVVIVVGAEDGAPIVIAEARDAAGLRSRLHARLRAVAAQEGDRVPVRLVDDPRQEAPPAPGELELLVWVSGRLFAASTSSAALRRVAEAEISHPFVGTRFHGRIADAYRREVDWLLAADIHGIGQRLLQEGWNAEALRRAGVLEADVLMMEQLQTADGRSHSQATVTFDGPRRGMASWLAAPAPMGSLAYVSPQASLVASLAIKDPALAVDDLLGVLEALGPDAMKPISEMEAAAQVRLREDLAAPLGGELTLAVDGPWLPFPAWKAIVEVYDPVRFQSTLEWLCQNIDVQLRREGERGIVLERAEAGPRTFYWIHATGGTAGVHYVLEDGYAIFAADRALLERALGNRDAGHSLTRSAKFRALCPADGNTNFSALVYQDVTSELAPILSRFAPAGSRLGDAAGSLAKAAGGPSLGYAYAEEDRIVFAADDVTSALGLDLQALLGAAGPLGSERATP